MYIYSIEIISYYWMEFIIRCDGCLSVRRKNCYAILQLLEIYVCSFLAQNNSSEFR